MLFTTSLTILILKAPNVNAAVYHFLIQHSSVDKTRMSAKVFLLVSFSLTFYLLD